MSRDDEDGHPRCVWCGREVDELELPICDECWEHHEAEEDEVQ